MAEDVGRELKIEAAGAELVDGWYHDTSVVEEYIQSVFFSDVRSIA